MCSDDVHDGFGGGSVGVVLVKVWKVDLLLGGMAVVVEPPGQVAFDVVVSVGAVFAGGTCGCVLAVVI